MKILYESDLAGSKNHGMAYRIYQFSKEFVESGHEVMIVAASYSHVRRVNPCVKKNLTDEIIDGIKYKWIKTPKYSGNGLRRVIHMLLYNFKLCFFAKKIARDFRPDVVIASGVTPLDFIGCYRIARKAKAKIVLEVGDLWPLTPIELGGYSSKHPFIRFMQKAEDYAYQNTDNVISLLPCAKDYMVGHGLSPEKFYFIPNGIVVQDWKQTQDLPLEHQDVIRQIQNRGKFMVGYAGTHSISNALYTLLEAALKLKNKDVEFVLVGEGPIKEDLIKYSQSKNIENVHFLPGIPKASVPTLLKRMDALYVGFQRRSLYRFGISPNKIYDYMMAGKPIIQAIEAGNNIVKEAKCGLYVTPDNIEEITNAILELKEMSSTDRKKLGDNGNQYVLQYHSYEVLTGNYLNILNNLIKQ